MRAAGRYQYAGQRLAAQATRRHRQPAMMVAPFARSFAMA
jgi:hypothetical protein